MAQKKGKACQEQNIKKALQKAARKAKSQKYVYDFGNKTDGDATQRSLLGGKGANLAEMAKIGLPVPPGFTITTEVCTYFYANKQSYPKVLEEQVRASVARTEKQLGKKLGDLKTSPAFGSLGSSGFHARYDGYHLEPWLERRNCRGFGNIFGNAASLGIATVASFKCMVAS